MRRSFHRSQRAGVLLDLVVAAGLILLGAFALSSLGISFGEILSGAGHFFGY
jgi:hypothetical protein